MRITGWGVLWVALVAALAPTARPQEPAPASVLVLRGMVVEIPGGAGLDGARVAVYPLAAPLPGGRQELWPVGAGAPIAEGVTKSDGSYRLELPKFPGPSLLLLQAEASGHAAQSYAARAREDELGEVIADFSLPPAASFKVRVTDPQGAPVAGARLLLIPAEISVNDHWQYAAPIQPVYAGAPSGNDGVVRVPGVLPGPYFIRVQSGGRGGAGTTAELRGGEEIAVELCPPRSVRGRVLAEKTREPIPGAQVYVCDAEGAVLGGATSDVHGDYRMDDLPTEELRLSCVAQGYDENRPVWKEGETGLEEIVLSSWSRDEEVKTGRASIRGIVRQQSDASPMAEVEVRAAGKSTRTDSDGRFRIDGLPVGSVEIVVLNSESREMDCLALERFELVEGEEHADVLVECTEQPCTIRGSVRTADGRCVAGAQLFAVFGRSTDGWTLDTMANSVECRRIAVDLDGEFRASLTMNADAVLLVATHPLFGRARSPAVAVSETRARAPFELKLEGASLSGTVHDALGAPVEGAMVFSEETDPYPYGRERDEPVLGWKCRALTDRDGRFFLPGMPSGPRQLRVRRGDRDEGVQSYLWIDAVEPPGPIEIRLRPDRVVRGRLVDVAGNAVRARIVAKASAGAPWSGEAASGTDGAFEFKDVPLLTRGVRLMVEREGKTQEIGPFPTGGAPWAVEVR